MKQLTITYLPWVLSVITIWMTLLAGNKHPSAWAVGLGNQALWLTWIVVAGAWGLLPMNLALWILYARNHLKWAHDGGTRGDALLTSKIVNQAWAEAQRTTMPKRQLQMRIEVNVTIGVDRTIGDYVNEALTDLINRVDFKNGQMPNGRVLDYGADFNDVHVTVDLHKMNVTLP